MIYGKFMDIAALPLITIVILLYYSIRLLVEGNISIIRRKGEPPVKDEKMYAKTAGKLILFFAFAVALMTALLFWNAYIAVAEIIILTAVFVMLWSKMNKKYCK